MRPVRPVCAGCMVWMKPVKNGVWVEAGSRIWDADLWGCPECGQQIVTGFAQEPLWERYQGETKFMHCFAQSMGSVRDADYPA